MRFRPTYTRDMAACPRCGEDNPDRARFCLACGAPLQLAPATAELRKTVTVLFADIKDSTPLGERLDPEAIRTVMSRYFADVRAVIEHHGGTVEKFIGDAVMAVFGTPTVHEDDPLRAVRAATEMRTTVADLNRELDRRWSIQLSIRTGINTGEVVAGDPGTGQTFVTGDAVNVASRLEHAAGAGEILIGDTTYRLVRDAVLVEPVEPLELKGKSQPLTPWRVLGVVVGAPAVARRLDSPLVGRERELTILRHAFERAAADETCQLVTILGPAGAGKSRLAGELLDEIDEQATVLVGRCLPYGVGITFWPVVEIVKRAAGLGAALAADEARRRVVSVLGDEPEAAAIAERLGGLLGFGSAPSDTNEIFWAVRKLLQALARAGPVVVLFEDVHWGEKTFLDLVDHIVDWARDTPILLVCLARPELLEERPSWAGGKLNSTSLLLEPLADEACGTMIENLLDRAEVAAEVKQRIARSAEGNPLFVEELLAMLIDEGALRRTDGRWVAATDLSSLAVPPTIQALLDARLDRLTSGERTVLERAAVAGRIFSGGAVRALSAPEEHPFLDDRLGHLMRKQLIRPHRAEFSSDHTYRFRHSLIRDAAYRQMSKGTRAELHERFAEWIENSGERPSAEQEEILGFHLEQAHRFRAEIGGDDERAARLGKRAAERLASAGRRAFSRGDMPGAVGLLTRATLLLDDKRERAQLAPNLGAALIEVGELTQADTVLERASEAAAQAGDRQLKARADMARIPAQLRLFPEQASGTALRLADDALSVFAEAGDELGLAEAWRRIGDVHWMASRWQARSDALEQALDHARRAGDRREEADIMASLGLSLLWGPMPAGKGISRFEQLLEEVADDPVLEAHVLGDQAGLEAMLGRFDEAREHYGHSVRVLRDRGLKRALGAQTSVGADIELLAGDPEAAERELRLGCEIAEETANKSSLPTLASVLAEALYLQGRFEEAASFVDVSVHAAAPDDIASHILWRRVRAKLLARDGRTEEAAQLTEEAVALAEQTDALNLHAAALISLAEVRLGDARDGSTAAALEAAIRLYERKENLVRAERARAFLAEVVA
jgi:class 3 adenylate cyclase/tetratricopeptide (TPR) repeat protein